MWISIAILLFPSSKAIHLKKRNDSPAVYEVQIRKNKLKPKSLRRRRLSKLIGQDILVNNVSSSLCSSRRWPSVDKGRTMNGLSIS